MGFDFSEQSKLFAVPIAEKLLKIDDSEKEILLQSMENVFNQLLSRPKAELFQALYRLDVNEEKVQQILQGRMLTAGASVRKMSKARALAELTLDREIQKAKSRSEI